MIRWLDQPSELRLATLDTLYAELSAADALLIETRRAGATVVLVDREARTQAMARLASSAHEQGGLLLGQAYLDGAPGASEGVALVRVRAAVASTDASGSSVSLRMESSVWSQAKQAMRQGELIVGWYHSHPGLGAFFSQIDRKTQRAFFPHAYSLGWVVDPRSGEEKWFLGAACEELPPQRVIDVAAALPVP